MSSTVFKTNGRNERFAIEPRNERFAAADRSTLFRLEGDGSPGQADLDAWILAGGAWNDGGVWLDSATWIEG